MVRTPEFDAAVAEVARLHFIKLRWLVPPLKSLSLGQGNRLPAGEKLRENGLNYATNEKLYVAKAVLIDPREYLRLPSHLEEMARVDKFASICGTNRENPLGLSPQPVIDPIVDGTRVFLGAWSGAGGFRGWGLPEVTPDRWIGWMSPSIETGFYGDGAIIEYSGGMRSGSYWNWPFKFENNKPYYNPKINPRSSNDVEAILKGLASGKVSNQPTVCPPYSPPPPVVPQEEKKPTNTVITPRNQSKPVAKPVPKVMRKRNTIVPIPLPKRR